jgi:hypothetical protein
MVEHSGAWTGREGCRGTRFKWIDGQLRGDSCEDVGLWGCVGTDALKRSFGDCTWPTMATSMVIEEAAVDKRFHMSREGTLRWDSRGGYSTSVDIEIPRIEESEVVRE